MGFYNIVLEGQQAEEYKNKKAEGEIYEKTFGHSKEYMNRNFGKDFGGEKGKKGYVDGGQYEKTDKDGTDHYYPSGMVGARNNDKDIRVRRWSKDPEDGSYVSHKPSVEDLERRDAARRVSARANGDPNWDKGWGYDREGQDVVNRHMRRHPDQWDGDKRIKTRSESGIFESVEFLND